MECKILSFLKKLLLFFIIVSVLLVSMASCSESPDVIISDEMEIHTTKVIKDGRLAEYGNYIFIASTGIKRYNRVTGEVSSVCANPECDGTCLLESPLTTLSQVVDGKLFFSTEDWRQDKYIYASLNIATGDVRVIRILEEKEADFSNKPIVDGGYIYFIRKVLKNGGNKELPEDYLSHVCRISINGGNEEIVYLLSGERYIHVFQGNLLTSRVIGDDQFLYMIDLSTKEEKIIFDCSEHGYNGFGGNISFLDEKIYFFVTTGEYMQSKYSNSKTAIRYIGCVDINTSEYRQITELPVGNYSLTDDAIYYVPLEYQYLYIPLDYQNNPKRVITLTFSPDLHVCDLNGYNDSVIYTNDKMDYAEIFTVVNGCLYGYHMSIFDAKNHCWGESFLGKIDLTTGELSKAKYVE